MPDRIAWQGDSTAHAVVCRQADARCEAGPYIAMNHALDAALDDCLALLRAGADRQICLARYPQYASELQALLELASDVQAAALPAPTAAAHDAGQHRMLDALAQRRPR